MLNELLKNGLVPDETTYNTIIYGYCSEGNVEEAFQFHNKMVENSFKPDVYTCNILLHGLSSKGMLDKALKLFNTWDSKGKTIDAVTYNTVISALCKNGNLEDAFNLVAEMELKKLGPNQYTYSAILGALHEAGRIKEAEELMSKMIERGMISEEPLKMDKEQGVVSCENLDESDSSAVAYSEQIIGFCNEGKYKDAMRIFGEVAEKGIAVNKSTCVTLMNALIQAENK